MKKIEESAKIGGKDLVLSTGHVAGQATGAVMATYGETVVLATVVSSPLKEDRGYFPLNVEYQERLYAGGRIKGSRWVKREGRPSDDDILIARLIDRSIRPLFSENYKREVQVIVTVLSVDMENSPDIPAAAAVSAAISSSSIPWMGPVSVVKVGMKNGKFVTNPTDSDLSGSEMELVVSTTKDAVVMIEAGANQISEETMIEGIKYAQKESRVVLSLINKFAKSVGNEKEVLGVEKKNIDLKKRVKKLAGDEIKGLIEGMSTKKLGYSDYDEVKAAVVDSLAEDERSQAKDIFEKLFKDELRRMILSGKRPDGRKPAEVRDLSAIVGILPRTHGSAIFNRGNTQALSITTLGAPSLEQLIETAEGEEKKRYIHHYSMPPYSVGETGRVGSPSRREIGHGALAERALLPVIPDEETFPYTIRVVTEILSSNGSTSMASTCGSTLSLMDAGVPIKAPIAGIAMGLLIEDEKKYKVLSDIVGVEDGCGDMDFKVAGSKDGITALQLDVKTLKLTAGMLEDALKQAKDVRMKILKVIEAAIKEPRATVSKYAPKIKIVRIDKEKIGELIGPSGKTIKGIIAETGAQIDVDDDGSVFISGSTEEELAKGVEYVEAIVKDPQPGEIYKGTVKRVQAFGAFVEILPNKEGLVHVSDMREEFVSDPSDVVSVGEEVDVRVKEIDDMGRLNLSMMLDPEFDKRKEEMRRKNGNDRNSRGRSDSRRTGPRGYRNQGDRGRSMDRRRPRMDRKPGPHFPTTRFLDSDKKGRR